MTDKLRRKIKTQWKYIKLKGEKVKLKQQKIHDKNKRTLDHQNEQSYSESLRQSAHQHKQETQR